MNKPTVTVPPSVYPTVEDEIQAKVHETWRALGADKSTPKAEREGDSDA